MNSQSAAREQLLAKLDRTVADAEKFFVSVPESLRDGSQTAREVLAHLVFWHCEYMHIAEALADGRACQLRRGAGAELNALAVRQLRDEPMPVLARRLTYRQKRLTKQLSRLPEWSVDFPVKAGGEFCAVSVRLAEIETHIRRHVAGLRHAARAQGVTADRPSATVDLFAPAMARRHLRRLANL